MSDTANLYGVQWGERIPLGGGRRPAWLTDSNQMIRWYSEVMGDHWWDRNAIEGISCGDLGWDEEVLSIRLPADHPHYKQAPTRTTDEQLTHYAERCKALVEQIAAYKGSHFECTWTEEARAIVASMVEVDGDLVEARNVAADQCLNSVEEAVAIKQGNLDQSSVIQLALAAIRRGRALERGD